MAQDIDRKLRLTAALLGTAARKDLAAAFRRVNPNTAFDIGRADKWLVDPPREGAFSLVKALADLMQQLRDVRLFDRSTRF